jgi:uncharacterized protein (TIGR00297 family)
MLPLPPTAHLALAAVLAVVIVGAARAAKALSVSGAVAAAVVGFLLFGLGGGQGAASLLLFFITSSALSRVGKRRKDALRFEKGGERDAGQVLANGGVAAAFALLLPVLPDAHWPIAALLGALAAANADTWATEIGSLAKAPPRLITTFQPAPTGSSGAVSLPGTLAALSGATLIGGVALFWGLGARGLIAVAVAGLCGSLLDSLLGATLQAQYRDAEIGKLTERTETADGKPNERARGLPWLDNDLVNATATLFGAAIAAVLSALPT